MSDDDSLKIATEALKVAAAAQATIETHQRNCETLGEQASLARAEIFKQIAGLKNDFARSQRKQLWALLGLCLTVIASLVVELVRGRM